MTALGLALTLIAAWAVMAHAGSTPVARLLHRWLVEAPARWLASIGAGWVVTAFACAGLFAVIGAVEGEALRIASMMTPEAVSWLALVDAGTLVDLALTAVVARSALRLREIWTIFVSRSSRPRPRARRPPIASRPRRPPANDVDERPTGTRLAA